MSKFARVLTFIGLLAGFAPLAAQAAPTSAQGQTSQQTTNGGQAEAGGY